MEGTCERNDEHRDSRSQWSQRIADLGVLGVQRIGVRGNNTRRVVVAGICPGRGKDIVYKVRKASS